MSTPHRSGAFGGAHGVEVADPAATLAAIEAAYTGGGVRLDRADGLTVRLENGSWFTVRPSGDGPGLRFTAGGPDAASVRQLGDVVLALVRGVGLEAAA
ncbi:hypothetical protein [Streptomyces sp. NBC_00083]|uniref:hypothetical protein n=1 Tax=Streptomyces sp. NBC_00083 TaxID=2975647 RepID=UPI00224DAA87|nr:hypothetical protein [Streptomyces sp. NBC_00083]MCX5388244.1 hypothetical protein [Streptomyces sp. NBC_00083]